jgi:hypothetical protein
MKAYTEAIGSVVDEAKVKELMGESLHSNRWGLLTGCGRRTQGDAARPSQTAKVADAEKRAADGGRRTEASGVTACSLIGPFRV